jgi:hypothetical protein
MGGDYVIRGGPGGGAGPDPVDNLWIELTLHNTHYTQLWRNLLIWFTVSNLVKSSRAPGFA